MLSQGTLLQNRYKIVHLIAQGGMGAVYQAIDQQFSSVVALKESLFADPLLRKAFNREARLLASMQHPSLPKIIDHFTEGDGEYLIMEYIPGNDLESLLKQNGGPFPLIDVLHWGEQLLEVLNYLHTQKRPIIHRDIKPQNLKLNDSRIILLDFGLAKDAPGHVTNVTTNVTSGYSIRGFTPHYAPLEQIQGSGTDARSDLYALAATLFHMLTGLRPPDAMTRALRVLDGMPDPLSPAHEFNIQVLPAISQVLLSTMALNRNQRPPTAAAMLTLLRDASQYWRDAQRARAPVLLSDSQQVQTGELPTMPIFSSAPPISQNNHLEPRILFGHKDAVTAVAFCNNGIYGISSSLDNTLRLWNLENGKEIRAFRGHADGVLSVVLSPNNILAASAGRDKTIRVWDINSGHQLRCFSGHTGEVNSVAFSADGRRVISGSADKSVRLWDIETGIELKHFTGHNFAVYSVAYSPYGRCLLSGSWKVAILWADDSGKQLFSFKDHAYAVNTVAFTFDARLVLTCSWNSIRIFELESGLEVTRLEGHSAQIETAAFSPDGRRVLSGSRDNTARLWYIENGREIRCLKGHTSKVTGVAFSPDGRYALTGSEDKTLRLWLLKE